MKMHIILLLIKKNICICAHVFFSHSVFQHLPPKHCWATSHDTLLDTAHRTQEYIGQFSKYSVLWEKKGRNKRGRKKKAFVQWHSQEFHLCWNVVETHKTEAFKHHPITCLQKLDAPKEEQMNKRERRP